MLLLRPWLAEQGGSRLPAGRWDGLGHGLPVRKQGGRGARAVSTAGGATSQAALAGSELLGLALTTPESPLHLWSNLKPVSVPFLLLPLGLMAGGGGNSLVWEDCALGIYGTC